MKINMSERQGVFTSDWLCISSGKGLACVFKYTFNCQQIHWSLPQAVWTELFSRNHDHILHRLAYAQAFHVTILYEMISCLCVLLHSTTFTPSIKVNKDIFWRTKKKQKNKNQLRTKDDWVFAVLVPNLLNRLCWLVFSGFWFMPSYVSL